MEGDSTSINGSGSPKQQVLDAATQLANKRNVPKYRLAAFNCLAGAGFSILCGPSLAWCLGNLYFFPIGQIGQKVVLITCALIGSTGLVLPPLLGGASYWLSCKSRALEASARQVPG